ncbi:cytoskeleton protein RodZ [Sinobacterium caligoides]|uniref:Cytoskeleton protein RodZ n=1 Tax=Sinobacterium caligoides TaxID=933926 RepID=A0A3N2DZ87_9GAMM|nr:RodZ family helix-turn-helix domain-containing protein [Sinobacterium caligoides]ROS05168.1 cytoskeleton protein RodZ [Sinobacterium caligoides]
MQKTTTSINDGDVLAPGQLLKQARNSKGLSIEDVALQLCITQRNVMAIETENFAEIGSTIFVTGYLKNYAKLLGVDADTIVAAYRNTHDDADEASRKIQKPQLSMHTRHRGHPLWMLLAVIIAVIAAFWVLWGDSNLRHASSVDSVKVETAAGSTVVESLVETKAGAEASILDTSLEPGVAAVSGLAKTVATDVVADLKDESDSVKPAMTMNQLQLDFNQDCWLEVRDGNGKRLYSGIKKSGQQLVLEGQPPFKLVIGIASAVSVRYMDETVEVVPTAGKKTAKLTVGVAG